MTHRVLQSEYLHWAKTRRPVLYPLSGSDVTHFPLDRLPFDIADLELSGASHYRYAPLREAIGAKAGVSPERVVAADGTSMANMLAMAALVAPGDEVLVEAPTYEPLLAVARFLGARVTRFARRAEDGFALDADAVARAVTPATTLIVLTNLHNPSGAYADEQTLRRIGGLGPRVLVDEVYLDAAFEEAPRSAARLGDRFVATASLTKVYGLSGLRCGWILAEPALAEAMWRLNELFGVAQAQPAERLSCLALAHLDEVAAGTRERLERNRGLANAFLASRADLASPPMRHGITAFPRLLSGDPEALDADLRARWETAIVPGRWFEAPDHFRIGVGGPTAALEEGLARLGAALDERR
ncbi:MAG: aminotransferase class I/II-fold pyridoxal phosphate-dependent enzyme [Alphaproteobacteria bacterium]|nr:aminotransferase class I/II-fold pyridoxal phosphate-dependent enzyme [Alphaproteobacteria bacterium]MBV9371465.1 aminotransferase class I/II-fold pyridoxal phosphate-dependent enzyme [Alphaproteobacteria bacterium]MBV9902402.1 aminotransferase class I/II-fold pyridoxal phosphate-dependent enzyme [Alphaproteobacteria bacterium]